MTIAARPIGQVLGDASGYIRSAGLQPDGSSLAPQADEQPVAWGWFDKQDNGKFWGAIDQRLSPFYVTPLFAAPVASSLALQADLPTEVEGKPQGNAPTLNASLSPGDAQIKGEDGGLSTPFRSLENDGTADGTVLVANPFPSDENTQNGGKGGCTGSELAMLRITIQSLNEELATLRHDNERLNRRIEQLGGKAPKRDRAAYIRDYRKRTKRMQAGPDPGRMARFLDLSEYYIDTLSLGSRT